MNCVEDATIEVERATGQLAWPFPLRIYINGNPVGSLRPKEATEFIVEPGTYTIETRLNHLRTEPLTAEVGVSERLKLVCTTNQLPLHPLHTHSLFLLFAFVLLWCIGLFVPAVRKFVNDHLVIEVLIGTALGMMGLFFYFRKLHAAGALTPKIMLSREIDSDELGLDLTQNDFGNAS